MGTSRSCSVPWQTSRHNRHTPRHAPARRLHRRRGRRVRTEQARRFAQHSNSGFLQLFGNTTVAQDPALYASASPLGLVTKFSAPTYFRQGTTDTVVPREESLAMQAALEGLSPPVVTTYSSFDAGHEFWCPKGYPFDDQQLVWDAQRAWVDCAMHNTPTCPAPPPTYSCTKTPPPTQ